MTILLIEFCYPPGRLQNVGGGREGRSIIATERLVIPVCGQSRRKHGAVIRIAGLKGNIIISYGSSRKALLLYTEKWDVAESFRLIKAKRSQKFATTKKEENITIGGVLMGRKRIKIQIQYSYQTMLLTT